MALTLLAYSPAIAAKKNSAKEQDISFSKKEIKSLGNHFALVRLYFKRNEKDASNENMFMEERYSPGDKYEHFIDMKTPATVGAICIGPGLFLAIDEVIEKEYVDRIELDDMQGGKTAAQFHGIMTKANGMLLKAENTTALKTKPIPFAPIVSPLPEKTILYEVALTEKNLNYFFRVGKIARQTFVSHDGEKGSALLTSVHSSANPEMMSYYQRYSVGAMSESPSLLLNVKKKAVGIALAALLPEQSKNAPLWRGDEVMADKRLATKDYQGKIDKIKNSFDKIILEGKITYRQKAEDDDEFSMSSFNYSSMREDDMKERYVYGIPVSRELLFIPVAISREEAKKIDKIQITLGNHTIEGKFDGALKDYAAFFIRVEKDSLPYRENLLSEKPLPMIEPLWSIFPRREFGGKRLIVSHTRFLGKTRAYKNESKPTSISDTPVGQFYVDESGTIRGLNIVQRREDETAEKLRSGGEYGYYDSEALARTITISRLADCFNSPPAHIDKTILWLPEKQEERKMWLGVELSGIDQNLAKALGIEKQTKDGSVGMILSGIYPNSPAASLGMTIGDILLSIKEVGKETPMELENSGHYGYMYGRNPYYEMYQRMPGNGPSMIFPTWSQRTNILTQLLEAIGAGKEIELTYLNGERNEIKQKLTISEAPADFDSATKHKNKETGLTVKELTYDVRFGMKLDDEFQALIISKVEEGSPASVARVVPLEMILEIDDKPITDIDTFKAIIEEAAMTRDNEGKVTLRFKLQALDKTHFADLTLEQRKGPQDPLKNVQDLLEGEIMDIFGK